MDLKIACVLRSGGDFDWNYVVKLYENISDNTEHEFEFVVFTDMEQFVMPKNVRIVPLVREDLKSYWSKLEIFNLTGQVIYFDLDTIIMCNIDAILQHILGEKISWEERDNPRFYMMEAFNQSREFSSGIMAWSGDFSYIVKQFVPEDLIKFGKWEQDYIIHSLQKNKNWIGSINDYINIASYKHHCKNGVHPIVDVVCFHGKPRPHEIGWKLYYGK